MAIPSAPGQRPGVFTQFKKPVKMYSMTAHTGIRITCEYPYSAMSLRNTRAHQQKENPPTLKGDGIFRMKP